MNETHFCQECGTEIPLDAPAGLCPKCLLTAGFESHAPFDSEGERSRSSPGQTGFQPPSVAELAPRFPHLEILELLGKGGMGAVYKARQPGLDRLVAVKILPPEVGRDKAFAERFTREARALARLNHPNIVTIHDFGQTDGLFFFVMEYIEGANLRQAMQAGRLKPEGALAIIPQICDALQYAHDEGIVHRDIKPENILLDKKGRLKIADFGLSKLLTSAGRESPEASLTGTNQVMGTLHYMAPEQMHGTKTVDHRADIYSLGVIFYELLTGDIPAGHFEPPSRRVQVDVRLDEVVLRALAREPAKRYQQASDVKTDVESVRSTPEAEPELSFAVLGTLITHNTLVREWLGQPARVRRVVKGMLWLGFFALALIFGSYAWRVQMAGGPDFPEMNTSVLEIGAFDPWFHRESYQGTNDDSSGFVQRVSTRIYWLSWSMLAGVLAVVLLSVIVGIERLDRTAKAHRRATSKHDRATSKHDSAAWRGTSITQTRFMVPGHCEVISQAIFHFPAFGYEQVEQRPDLCIFERGTKWAGLWSMNIRDYRTRLTVRTASAPDGRVWVSCDWSVRTNGAWITRSDIQNLQVEGREFEAMLLGKSADTE